MKIKKFTASLLAFSMLAGSIGNSCISVGNDTVNAAGSYNYAKALQESLYFYECQQCNELPEWNRVEWKGNSTMDDFIKGGWYDAGDHVKFNLPMAYSASMLAWGLYQYGDGVEKIGQYDIYKNNLEYVLDYLADCDLGNEVVFQVGNGTDDHTWWGPVELYEIALEEGTGGWYKRPYYTTTSSCVTGEMAAALAAGAAALKGKSDKTSNYIKHAENIFKIADKTRSDEDYNNSNASNFYRSSHFYDELFYAANWLYIATGDSSYLDKAKSYIPELGTELGTNELKYSWSQCWDDVMQGGMLLYAQNTGDETYISRVEKHIDYVVSKGASRSDGLCYIDSWGCLRYAATCGFMAAVASDTVLKNSSKVDTYKKFYEKQINYIMGDNPNKMCYIVGFDSTSPTNPHHRTAHGSYKNDMKYPTESRHLLYGALVGGPAENGSYEDSRENYINNEVATDYNAGFTALLCKMTSLYGGQTDSSFPPSEKRTDEYYVEAEAKTMDSTGVTLSLKFTNHTAWPARYEDDLSFRYYMDLSEVSDPENITIRCDRNQSTMYSSCKPAEISGVKHYSGSIYYIEVTMPDGRICLPISEGRQQCEFLLALGMPNYGSGWDSSNDFSYKGLGGKGAVKSAYIPIYKDGKLILGEEPDGTKSEEYIFKGRSITPVNNTTPATERPVTTTEPVVTTTEPVVTTTETSHSGNAGGSTNTNTIIYGDINGDGTADLTDLTILSVYIMTKDPSKMKVFEAGDIDGDGSIDIADLPRFKQYISKDTSVTYLGPKK